MYSSQVYIHLLWCTNDFEPYLANNKQTVRKFIVDYCKKKEIRLKDISVLSDHVHVLVKLSSTQSISDLIQRIKGTTSNWLNQEYFKNSKFKWQDGYYAFSVGFSHLETIQIYFDNQKDFHSNRSVGEELSILSDKYKIKKL